MKFHYPLLYQTSFLKAKSREEIRQFLTEYREIKKIYSHHHPMKNPWCFLKIYFFNLSNNQVKEIEIYSPNSAFYMQGVDIFSVNLKKLKDILHGINKKYKIDDDGLCIDDGVLIFYMPDYPKSGDLSNIESVLIREHCNST